MEVSVRLVGVHCGGMVGYTFFSSSGTFAQRCVSSAIISLWVAWSGSSFLTVSLP